MDILKNIRDYQTYLTSNSVNNASIGFVATMGSLHAGHLSLVERSNAENDITVCSIFVNPTQFNEQGDYANYPRDLNRDIEFLKTSGCSALFVPSEDEMYPPDNSESSAFWHNNITDVNLSPLDKEMEGKHRPGHFKGVATIVQKLFYIIKPNKAYFGDKDYQQLAIIRYMTQMLDLNIDIVGCTIIRESDGLAMSSRNALLSKEQRQVANILFKTLEMARDKTDTTSVEKLEQWIRQTIDQEALCEVQYVRIVDNETLVPLLEWTENEHVICCIAVFMGTVRLIDNISLFP